MDEDFEFGEVLQARDTDISLEQWDRARQEIDHIALIEELTGLVVGHTSVISCPMGTHRDSTPSFNIYRKSNSSYCFGCPPPKQNQTYDNINFVAKWFDINKVEALKWIEKHYKLPAMAGVPEPDYEEDEEDEEYTLTVDDLIPIYLQIAPGLIESVEDAKSLLKKYFLAIREDDPLFLARVIGRERLESIMVGGRSQHGGERR